MDNIDYMDKIISRDFINQILDMFFIMDPHSKFMIGNKACMKLIGFDSEKDMINKIYYNMRC